MTDLSKITTPFGLLDEATQDALRAHGGPYQVFREECDGYDWHDPRAGITPDSHAALAWRVKPQPPKPREWWLHEEDDIVLPYTPDKDGSFKERGYIHVREAADVAKLVEAAQWAMNHISALPMDEAQDAEFVRHRAALRGEGGNG